jgi:hypothetical protein
MRTTPQPEMVEERGEKEERREKREDAKQPSDEEGGVTK